jgi:hypothetical protein
VLAAPLEVTSHIDEAGIAEDPQMLGHGGAADDPPAGRLRERFEGVQGIEDVGQLAAAV